MDPEPRAFFWAVMYAVLLIVFIAVVVAILDNRGVIYADVLRTLIRALR